MQQVTSARVASDQVAAPALVRGHSRMLAHGAATTLAFAVAVSFAIDASPLPKSAAPLS